MDEINIVEYDPYWPGRYVAEAEFLRSVLPPELVVAMEHIGSTAVPGLSAKPVIDILIVVRSVQQARAVAVPALEDLGYAFWSDNPRRDRLFFVKGLPPDAPYRTHHLHMAEPGSDVSDILLFRDYLRSHPKEASRYATIKLELMEHYRADREGYTAAKSSYVEEVLVIARAKSPRI